MNKTKLIFVLLTSLALGACSNSDDDELTSQQPKFYPMTIEVTENPMVQDGEGGGTTRAAITTNSSLDKFYMSYVYGSEASSDPITATKGSEGKWSSTGSWPGTSDEVTWYAYTDDTFNQTEDANKLPYINFTVEEAAASQHDLLVATASGTYSGTGGKLTFTFDHACSALRFYVKKSPNLDSYTLSVSSIVLKNVKKHGKYYYGTSSWNDIDTYTNYTLYSGSAMTLGSDKTKDYVALNGNFGTAGEPYLFIIPQTLTAWDTTGDLSNTYLELTCTITNTSTSTQVYSGTAYIPYAATFEKGTKYDVKINIGKNSLYSGPRTKIISD
ncbi:fimbrillin family protein [uncultured Prevotella sp.]|uniref:fimbrillin family protein n=1 Tax=uncultured Prevotella sp. TaxID=159272 RepID=UPI0025D621C9|nr:fimbrillin family protein [uncultured Prevotella sp.]